MAELIDVTKSETSASDADVIFVHGLGGDAKKTWGFDQSENWSVWLAGRFPTWRVWSLGYDAAPSKWVGATMPLVDRGLNVLALLDAHGIGERPTSFVTHSMGGLVTKQVLRHADSRSQFKHIVDSTRSVSFLATPHAGSDLAALARFLHFFRPSVSMTELEAHAPMLRDLNLWFRESAADLEIRVSVFYEGRRTKGMWVVDATSADPGITGVTPIPVDANHVEICKPADSADLVALATLRFLESLPSRSVDVESPGALAAGRAVLEVGGIELYPDLDDAVRVHVNVNGIEYIYPTLDGIDWLEPGPDMSPQRFKLPGAASYEVGMRMQTRRGTNMVSVSTDQVSQLPHEAWYKLHGHDGPTRSGDVSAAVRYRLVERD